MVSDGSIPPSPGIILIRSDGPACSTLRPRGFDTTQQSARHACGVGHSASVMKKRGFPMMNARIGGFLIAPRPDLVTVRRRRMAIGCEMLEGRRLLATLQQGVHQLAPDRDTIHQGHAQHRTPTSEAAIGDRGDRRTDEDCATNGPVASPQRSPGRGGLAHVRPVWNPARLRLSGLESSRAGRPGL